MHAMRMHVLAHTNTDLTQPPTLVPTVAPTGAAGSLTVTPRVLTAAPLPLDLETRSPSMALSKSEGSKSSPSMALSKYAGNKSERSSTSKANAASAETRAPVDAEGSSVGIVIGVCVSCAAVVAVVGMVLMCQRQRRRSPTSPAPKEGILRAWTRRFSQSVAQRQERKSSVQLQEVETLEIPVARPFAAVSGHAPAHLAPSAPQV